MKVLREKGLEDVGVLVGGIIPEEDIPKLQALGVRAVFGPGTTIPEIVGFLQNEQPETQPRRSASPLPPKGPPALARLLTLAARGQSLRRSARKSRPIPAKGGWSRSPAAAASGKAA